MFAVHFTCDASKRSVIDTILKAQFNRRRPSDMATLPDGMVCKYISYRANCNNLMPNKVKRQQLEKLRIRQRNFQKAHMTATIQGVNGLDTPLDFGDDGHLSLQNIMMSTRCQSNWDHPLFRLVD